MQHKQLPKQQSKQRPKQKLKQLTTPKQPFKQPPKEQQQLQNALSACFAFFSVGKLKLVTMTTQHITTYTIFRDDE